ncbi:hypothetical protein [Phycicoccus flavus]|uniref:Uncharacterized protein n=1 Tax=Phycicoccus flavus TaxID=2502783 RepID=A0A8T6QY13_9MICO|nr:hypothetical protein [Phycicoccus flavus]NHA66608.1 hypothetical protein [Phycicoccus flavus]
MKTLLARLRARLAAVDTGNDFVDSCCHRVGGRMRAGSPAQHPGDPIDPPTT